jgi:hypothetical protein
MAGRVKVWFDPEANFLEVIFSDAPGFMRETENEAVMECVDVDGNFLGFSIVAVSQLAKSKPLIAEFIIWKGKCSLAIRVFWVDRWGVLIQQGKIIFTELSRPNFQG